MILKFPCLMVDLRLKKKIGHHIKLISVEQSYIICTGVIMTIYFRQILEDSLALAEKPMSSIWE